MKFPPEIDELMWQVAESDDTAAADEFVIRYPEYKEEFARRIRMVRSLKGSRPKQKVNHGRFMPSANVEVAQPSRLALAGAILSILAGSVLATVGAVRWFDSRQPAPIPDSVTETVQNPFPAGNQPDGGAAITPPEGTQTPGSQAGEEGAVAATDPFARPVTIVASQISLNAALDDIARQAGVQLESAPGMEDQEIMLDYRGVPAIEVMRDLGRNFGFTVFVQGERVALLVPARDPSAGGTSGQLGRSGPPIDPNDSRGGLSPLPGTGGQ